jgi:hypothetical protein
MKTYSVTQTIHADADAIWSILTDGPKHPEWNKGVTQIEGDIALGNRIKLHTTIGSGQVFTIEVVEFVPTQKMVWRSGMPFGLFQGVRTFTLTVKGEGVTEFHMAECFSGLMAPLIVPSIPDLTPTFEDFAASLKATAEGN